MWCCGNFSTDCGVRSRNREILGHRHGQDGASIASIKVVERLRPEPPILRTGRKMTVSIVAPLLLAVCLSGCVTPEGVAMSILARELRTPERGEQRFELQGKPYQEYAQDRYDCLLRHEQLSLFVACMEARGYRRVKS
jgi:hypothetical protein